MDNLSFNELDALRNSLSIETYELEKTIIESCDEKEKRQALFELFDLNVKTSKVYDAMRAHSLPKTRLERFKELFTR